MLCGILSPTKDVGYVHFRSIGLFKLDCVEPQRLLLRKFNYSIKVEGSCCFYCTLVDAGLCIFNPNTLAYFFLFLCRDLSKLKVLFHSVVHCLLNY